MKEKLMDFVALIVFSCCLVPVFLMPSLMVCYTGNIFIGASEAAACYASVVLAFISGVIFTKVILKSV